MLHWACQSLLIVWDTLHKALTAPDIFTSQMMHRQAWSVISIYRVVKSEPLIIWSSRVQGSAQRGPAVAFLHLFQADMTLACFDVNFEFAAVPSTDANRFGRRSQASHKQQGQEQRGRQAGMRGHCGHCHC